MSPISIALMSLMIALYGVASVLYVGYVPFPHWGRSAAWTARAGWAVHSLGLAVRLWETGRPPFLSFFESVLFFTWVLVLNYVVLDYFLNLRVGGAFVIPTAFWFLMGSLVLPKEIPSSTDPMLSGNWLVAHVFIGFLAYGAFLMGCLTAMMYLIQEYQLRRKAFSSLFHRLPSLEILDHLTFRLNAAGFGFLTLAVITGAVWARPAWGRHWGWESKETWSLIVWGIYGAYLLGHRLGLWRGRKGALFSLIGFLAVAFNFLAVNFWLTRLHRYF